jgi:hypothetical protein
VASFQAVVQKSDKIHELPKIPKGLVCFVGKIGVLTCVLYIPDMIDSEDLTVIIVTGFQGGGGVILAHFRLITLVLVHMFWHVGVHTQLHR